MDRPSANPNISRRLVTLLTCAGIPAVALSATQLPLPALPDDEVDRALAEYQAAVEALNAINAEVDAIQETRPAGLNWSDAIPTETVDAQAMLDGNEPYKMWAKRVADAMAREDTARKAHGVRIREWEIGSGFHDACVKADAAMERVDRAEAAIYTCRPTTLQGVIRKLEALQGSRPDPHREPNLSDPDYALSRVYEFLAADLRRLA